MIEKNDLTVQLERIQGLNTPVLSLYADVNTSRDPNSHAVQIRLKNTFKGRSELPPDLVRRVMAAFEGPIRARSRAVFANEETMEVVDADLDFLDDSGSDQVRVYWGEPHVYPLLALIDEYPPYLLLCVDRDHVRGYEAFMGRIEALFEREREPVAEEQDDIEPSKKQLSSGVASAKGPGARSGHTIGNRQSGAVHLADRADASAQLADEHIEHSRQAFYQEVGRELPQWMGPRDIERLLVLGPDRGAHAFASALPSGLRDAVDAILPPPGDASTPAALLESVRPKLEELADHRKGQLLDTIAERGLTGVSACVQALQEGRLHALVAPDRLGEIAFVNSGDGGTVALNEADAQALDPDGKVTRVELAHALPRLADRFGTRLELVRGDSSRRLVNEFGGMGAIRRY